MVFDSEHYTIFMYVSILVVTVLIFFNSINIVETGLGELEKSGEDFGRGLTGFVVGEVGKNVAVGVVKQKESRFAEYLEKLSALENDGSEVNRRGLTGLAVAEEEDEDDEEVSEEPEGELYTEGSYMVYFALLGFLGLCIFILSAVFLIPRFKGYT